MSTYSELLQNARKLLKDKEINDAEVDAWYLMSHVFKISRTDLLLRGNCKVEEIDSQYYMRLINMRASYYPLQYIIGTQEFMGLEFDVTSDVLIPRQDTEILVEEVLKLCEGKSVLDMCTGSGCIIISIAMLGKPRTVAAADISEAALQVATRNAMKHGTKIEFIKSDLFDHIDKSYDIIVSNPPYIPTKVIQELMPEVREHEPLLALDGDQDGLSFYRRIAAMLKKHLNKDGAVLVEIGHDQGKAVSEILLKEGLSDIVIKKDLSGLDRVVIARKL